MHGCTSMHIWTRQCVHLTCQHARTCQHASRVSAYTQCASMHGHASMYIWMCQHVHLTCQHGHGSTRVPTVQVQSPCHHGLPCSHSTAIYDAVLQFVLWFVLHICFVCLMLPSDTSCTLRYANPGFATSMPT